MKQPQKNLEMDFHRLSRRDLQSLCKKNKIRANMSNKAMADVLNSLKSVKRKAKGNKSAQKMKLRKKCISKACESTKCTQEKEIISPCVARMEIEGQEEPSKCWIEDDLLMLSYPFPEAKGPEICSDVIFSIILLLPTETILRLKIACRDWAHIISDPVFIRAHCSRPHPITSFFTHYMDLNHKWNGRPYHFFKPLPSSPKFPTMITEFLSNGFQTTSTSHGLVCLHRDKDRVIILANPATSHWSLIPRPPSAPPSTDVNDKHYYSPILIIYDPTLSLHFKLTIGTCDNLGDSLRFHIYSSETSSWTLSSVSPPDIKMPCFEICDLYGCKGSRIGGGSVCYLGDRFNTLSGYEIASDSYWATPLPWAEYQDIEEEQCSLLDRDGEIYCVVFYCKSRTVKVRRLDENKCWVLEGEGNGEGAEKFSKYLMPDLSYDSVRKALLITVNCEGIYALYLPSCRVEFLGEDHMDLGQTKFPHANTLASFYGAKQDRRALHALLAS